MIAVAPDWTQAAGVVRYAGWLLERRRTHNGRTTSAPAH